MTIERRHSVMGFLGGVSLGVGIALLLFVYGVVPMTVVWFVVIAVGLGILGWIFARVIPARDDDHDAPSGPQPTSASTDQADVAKGQQ
jgi:CHASE2 domain-containing sensor protein